MLKQLKRLYWKLFGRKAVPEGGKAKKGDRVGNVMIETDAQVIKHSYYKPGESYRVGEAIVTVHANKKSMLKAIATTNKHRSLKEKKLNKRAIQLMLMTPEELLTTQMKDWLAKRDNTSKKITAIMGAPSKKRYLAPKSPAPSGKRSERFKDIMNTVKVKEKA